MKMALIYCLICPIQNKPRYVGMTSRNLGMRLTEHKIFKNNNRSHKTSWLKFLKKQNVLDELKIELLEEVEESIAFEKEHEWIMKFKEEGFELVNMIWDGRHTNLHHSPETLEKIRCANKDRPKRVVSVETRKKISKSLIGSKRRLGKPFTAEAKRKISESSKGRPAWNKKTVNQYTLEGIFIKRWETVSGAEKDLIIRNISMAARGLGYRKQAGGFIWRYENELEK